MFKLLSILAIVRFFEFTLLTLLSIFTTISGSVISIQLILAILYVLIALFVKFFQQNYTILFVLALVSACFDIYSLIIAIEVVENSLTVYSTICMNLLTDFVLILLSFELMKH